MRHLNVRNFIANGICHQTAATGLLEQRVNELEAEKRKTVTRQNALKANSLVVSDELARLEAENLSLKQRIKDIEYAALEKSASGEKEVERLLTALRESEAELEAVKISLENLSRQIDATDHRAFMRWMEDVVLNDEHQLSGPAGTLSKRRNSSPTAEEIDIGRDPSAARDSAEVDSDTASSVKSLVVSLLVQWREQVGFYPRGANGPITKSEQRFLQRVSDLVLAANERCERAVLSARCAEEERLAAEQRCELMRTRLGLCAQQLHRYLRRTDFSERVISVERKHIIRANERLMSLYRNNHVEVMTHDQNMTRNLYEEQSKCNAIKVEKDVLSNKCRQLQCRVAELESQVGGAMGVRVREQATAALQSRVQTVEDTLHKWFKAELPRLLSGLPINEDDISMRNMFTDGDVLMYPLYSSVAASSDFMIHSQSRSYAMAQALCSSKAVQAAAELRAAGLVERNSVLKDRILELEGVIMRWRRSIEEQPSVLPDILNGRSDNAFASGMTSERVDIALVQHELATIRTKHLESEERATRLSAQLEQCQERSEAMRKLAEHLRREEREER